MIVWQVRVAGLAGHSAIYERHVRRNRHLRRRDDTDRVREQVVEVVALLTAPTLDIGDRESP